MTEKNFRKHVIKYLKEKGAYVRPQEGQANGTPDIFAVYKGTFYALELKGSTLSNGKKNYYDVTHQQMVQLNKINAAGGVGVILRHTTWWKDHLEAILKTAP